MAFDPKKLIYVDDTTGIYTEHDSANFQIALDSLRVGNTAADPSDNGGASIAATLNMNSQSVVGVATPTANDHAANKGYVDNKVTGLDVKASCTYITLSDIASILTADATTVQGALDTIGAAAPTLVANDRILVKDQSTSSENGIYEWDGSNLARAEDADINAEVTPGLFTFVEEGDLLADTGWVIQSDGPITVGSTALSWVQFSSAGAITAGVKDANTTFVTRDGNNIEFTELTEQAVVIGDSNNDPVKVVTSVAAVAGIADGSGTSGKNQIEASTPDGLTIKSDIIVDAQVKSDANIDATKLQVQASFSPANADTTPVSVASDDLVSTSLEKLQQNFNALVDSGAAPTNPVGANLIGVESLSVPHMSATTVQGAIDDLKGKDFTSGAAITAGHVVYVSADNTASAWADTTVFQVPVGLAGEAAVAGGSTIKVISEGYIGGLSGLTAGTRYYWNDTVFVSALPTGAGQYIWQIGTAISATEMLIDIDLIKRNTP